MWDKSSYSGPKHENIIVITDTIHAVRWIFNLLFHSYQLYLIAISQDLRAFFHRSSSSSITFWDCSSSAKCCPHLVVDQETKQFNIEPSFPCKSSWDFSKKEKCDSILQNWQMTSQASDYKGKNFLDLVDDNNLPTMPTYTKEGSWLNLLEQFNSLCVRATRAITNHAPIGEYWFRFFPKEPFACPCRDYPMESRNHILYGCRRFNKYWNPNRESLKSFVAFLEFNPEAFSFHEGIT